MDLGIYPATWVRWVMGEAQPQVTAATAVGWPADPRVDELLTAQLAWPDRGVTGEIHTRMADPDTYDITTGLVVEAAGGTLHAENPLNPQRGGDLLLTVGDGDAERIAVPRSATYRHQLEAFRDAITAGGPVTTTMAAGAEAMALLDACYRAAGSEPRPARP